MPDHRETLTLIGAGLAGPLLAIELKKRGYRVRIYERRPDMRRVRISAGRSINLALSVRGIHALRQAGVWKEMQRIIVPMRGRMMHSVAGELTFQPYGKDETEVINSISRAELNMALLTAAEANGVEIAFNKRCTDYDARARRLTLRDEHSGDSIFVEGGVVIATDGATSEVRDELLHVPRFNFSQQYLDYGYKELTIPAGPRERHLLETNALHIWPRGSYMLIALPNMDGTFACILFLPFEGELSFASLDSNEKVEQFFKAQFPDALALIPNLIENYNANPTGAMVTIKCFPWRLGGSALLLGDAAHAIVPFFGQGLNCAFEDCTVFLELLDRIGPNWEQVFAEFETARKVNTDAIADLALENFVEMRDKVGDPHFLLRKKVELALEARFPEVFVPKYAMVTFRRLPYSVALERGRIQDRILERLCDGIQSIDEVNYAEAEKLIIGELTPLGGR